MAANRADIVPTALTKPPPVLVGCRVVEYALRHPSVKYSGHSNLFVDGKDVGPVPRLAIARDRRGDVVLLHCNRTWEVLGIAGYENLRKAKRAADRIYPGISKKWVQTGISKRQAETYLKRTWKGEECSFCGRRPDQIQKMVAKRSVRVCDVCVREFNTIIQE